MSGRSLRIFLVLCAAIFCSVQIFGKLLPPKAAGELIDEAVAIVHGRIVNQPVAGGTIAALEVEVIAAAKGGSASGTIVIDFSLVPPCTPDKLQPVPEEVVKGAEFILFLGNGDAGHYIILEQWQGSGMVPYSPEKFEEMRKNIQVE